MQYYFPAQRSATRAPQAAQLVDELLRGWRLGRIDLHILEKESPRGGVRVRRLALGLSQCGNDGVGQL